MKVFSSFVLVVIALAGNQAVFGEAGGAATTQSSPAVVTVRVKRGELLMKFEATGYFEAVEPFEVRIRPKTYAGDLMINSIASNGSVVKKGDLLLEIDTTPLRKQLGVAENELMAANANLQKMEADFKLSEASEALTLKTQQNAVADAENAISWWEKVDGPQMVQQWELQVKQYKDMVDDRSDELGELKKMYKTEELTSATADIVVKRAVRGLEQSQIQLNMEKERLEKNKATYYPVSKRAVTDALLRAKQALASLEVAQTLVKSQWKTTLFTAKTAVATATQKVDELKRDLAKMTVTAPGNGVVWLGQNTLGNWQGGDAKTLREGEKVTAQQVLMTLFEPGKVRLVSDLSESKYYSVAATTAVTITPSAFPDLRIPGKCEAMPRMALTTPTGPVYPMAITLAGEVDLGLIPGMRATIQFDVPPLKNVLVLPATAVVSGAVWIRADGGEKKVSVVTGHTDGKSVEIVRGLKDGDEVLTAGKP